MPPVRAILWDLGNVLVDWDPRRLYSQLFDDTAAVEAFLGGVCTMAWHARHDAGVTMAENRKPLIAAHPEHETRIRAWETRWDEMFDGPVERMDTVFEESCALGLTPYALSNLPAEKWPPLKAMYPFLKKIETAVISGEEGVIKPDPKIYEIVRQRIDTPPENTLFIDDRPENVAAGRKAGFQAIVFETEAQCRAALIAHGVNVNP